MLVESLIQLLNNLNNLVLNQHNITKKKKTELINFFLLKIKLLFFNELTSIFMNAIVYTCVCMYVCICVRMYLYYIDHKTENTECEIKIYSETLKIHNDVYTSKQTQMQPQRHKQNEWTSERT